MLKEQEAKEKEEREGAEKEILEREEQGLPLITVDELLIMKKKEREEEKEKEDEKKRKEKEEAEALVNGKPPKAPANEMGKLTGKSSPKGAKPEAAPKFNSLKPNV
jgi:predicted nucleic acid-binding protein